MKNQLSKLTSLIFNAPLWVQEVIYMDLKKNLLETLPGFTSGVVNNIVISTYIPELTFKGRQELKTHEHNFDFNIYKLLEGIENEQRIVDITLSNFWSLEQISSFLAFCIKSDLVKEPNDKILKASIFYLGGDIRLGEYVKRIDKISIVELDDVLRKQKIYNTENPDTEKKLGEFLIDMGYIANNDISKILNMKEEAKKRFILPSETNIPAQNVNIEYEEIQQKIQKLTAENKLLKDKLRAIFNIQNKRKEN